MQEKGPRHAGDARRDHRRPDLREVHPPRRPRAGARREGVPADDAAARPRRRGPDQARAHRQLGVPARRDGKGPPRARDLHEEHRRDGRAHRQEGQGVRPRHDPRRLRDAGDAVPELRRRRQGELPPLRLHRHPRGKSEPCGFSISKIPGGRAFELGRGRGVPARQADRPARGLPLEGGLAVHGRAQARPRRRDPQLEARVRLRRRRQARRRVGRAGRLRRAGKPRQVPEDAGQRLRVRHQLRVRALGRART